MILYDSLVASRVILYDSLVASRVILYDSLVASRVILYDSLVASRVILYDSLVASILIDAHIMQLTSRDVLCIEYPLYTAHGHITVNTSLNRTWARLCCSKSILICRRSGLATLYSAQHTEQYCTFIPSTFSPSCRGTIKRGWGWGISRG